MAVARFVGAVGVLQAVGFLFDLSDDIQNVTSRHWPLTILFIALYLLLCHIVWDLDRDRKAASFKAELPAPRRKRGRKR